MAIKQEGQFLESGNILAWNSKICMIGNKNVLQWMSVIRTSSGTAYNVLITGIKYIMDAEYKNTLGSSK